MVISIIIPIYKVEPYIEKCIESVIHQTYRDLEIILVDDCSPDRSMEIAKEAIEESSFSKDLLFKFMKHDKNRGLSAARNTGIDAATGEYLFFLDSDDSISNDCIEKLQSYTQFKYDIIQGGHYKTDRSLPPNPRANIPMKTNEEVLNNFIKGNIIQNAWNKLCNRLFIINNKLYFKDGLINEDDLWTFQCLCFSRSYFACSDITYIYNVRPNSIMTSINGENLIQNLIKIYGMKINFCVANNIYGDLTNQIIRGFSYWIFKWNKQKKSFTNFYIYKKLRENDKRTFSQKWKSYSCISNRIRYFYEFLPTHLSWIIFSFKLSRIIGYNK